jgi:putative transcriptional regulator
MAKKVLKKKKVDPYLKALGNKIVSLREAKGISQNEMARRLETFNNAVRRIEIGEVNSTINMLRRIAEILEVPVKELIDIKGF